MEQGRRPNPAESRYGSDQFKSAANALVGNFLSITGIDVRDVQSIPFLLAPASQTSHPSISSRQEITLARSGAARRLYAIHHNSGLPFETPEMMFVSTVLVLDLLAERLKLRKDAVTTQLFDSTQESLIRFTQNHLDEVKARTLKKLAQVNMRALSRTGRERIYSNIRENAWNAAEYEIDAFANRLR